MNVTKVQQTYIILIIFCILTLLVITIMDVQYTEMDKENLKNPEPQEKEDLQYSRKHISTEDLKVEKPSTSGIIQATAKPLKVLLLTASRSGSSYTGSLLASNQNTVYFYEPSRKWENKTFITIPIDTFEIMLNGMFFCDADLYKSKHKRLQSCEEANMIVVKTIRLRLNTSMHYLKENPDVKVIWLVRDPRGRIASLLTAWERRANKTNLYIEECEKPEVDLPFFLQLPNERKLLLKYENLVNSPFETVDTLANFLNITDPERMESFIKEHYTNITHSGYYYGHKQPEDFDPDHKWKTLPEEQLLEIETTCKNVMQKLGYKRVTT